MSLKSDVTRLFLRYQAHAERQHRRTVEYFKFLRSLRHAPQTTPPNPIGDPPNEPRNEPNPDPQPAENTPPQGPDTP